MLESTASKSTGWLSYGNGQQCTRIVRLSTLHAHRHSHTSTVVRKPACLLWPPCVAGADIIFLPCSFFLSFFSSPNLSGRRLDVYHTLTYGVAVVRI